MSDFHAIRRTSPKGPGTKFIGRCAQCGATGLRFGDMKMPCPNPSGMTRDAALIAEIEREEATDV